MKNGKHPTERVIALFLLGAILFNFPLLYLFESATLIAGIPLLYLYLFVCWAAFILCAALIIERPEKNSVDQTPNQRE